VAQKLKITKRSETIDRNVSNTYLDRFNHLSQLINNIFNAAIQIACDKRFFAHVTFGASIWEILCWVFLVV
jgi:hypothetical protein